MSCRSFSIKSSFCPSEKSAIAAFISAADFKDRICSTVRDVAAVVTLAVVEIGSANAVEVAVESSPEVDVG